MKDITVFATIYVAMVEYNKLIDQYINRANSYYEHKVKEHKMYMRGLITMATANGYTVVTKHYDIHINSKIKDIEINNKSLHEWYKETIKK